MPLISKPNYNQIFASQAPDQDKPAVFNNYPLGWGVESRPNNGKPTIKGFNYLQQTSDLKDLWILQNGACLPYDESIEYAEGAPVLKDGVIQYKTANGFKSRDSVTIPTYNNTSDGVDPVTGVADGAYFNVRSSNDNTVAIEYQNVSGVATPTGKSYPSGDAKWAASLVVDASGKNQQEINNDLKKATDFYVTPQMYVDSDIDITDGVVDAYPYIKAALDSGYPVKLPFPRVAYRVTQNIVFQGHKVEGIGCAAEAYGLGIQTPVVILFDGVTGDAVKNTGKLSEVSNIHFKQKDWSTELNGCFLERYAYFTNCLFTHFNGFGWYGFVPATEISSNPYHTVFTRCQFLFNKKHGVAAFQGANAVTLTDCMSRWNGSPAHSVAPTSVGAWDGIYIGYSADYPDSATQIEPQMIIVNGGDHSYNSRYGFNADRAFFSNLYGGYIEGNLLMDLRVGGSFGCHIDNPILREITPVLEVISQDPIAPSANLFNYPNSITANGRHYGNGLAYSGVSGFPSVARYSYQKQLPSFLSAGSVSSSYLYANSDGSITAASTANLYFNVVGNSILRAKRFRLGTDVDPLGATNVGSSFHPNGTSEDSLYFALVPTAGAYSRFYNAQGGGASSAATAVSLTRNTVTSRSINAGGTINASGADYAEYMYKSDGCGDIAKGEVVGVNSEGKLTKIFDEAISFVVKSTDPSIVGGDNWFTDVLPDDTTNEDKADFDERMELARQKVDRIAFCGQVPIIYNASVGDYIIPSRNSDGTIGIETTRTPTFEQHLKCVGKVWKVVDSTPHIVVFNN